MLQIFLGQSDDNVTALAAILRIDYTAEKTGDMKGGKGLHRLSKNREGRAVSSCYWQAGAGEEWLGVPSLRAKA
jgi:hypothetical protein